MSWLTAIPLAGVKTYLKVEHTDDDALIETQIEAACDWVENFTGHYIYDRAVNFDLHNSDCIRVHAYPINSVVKGLDKDGADVTIVKDTDYSVETRPLHTYYYGIDSDVEQLVLNVGYAAGTLPSGIEELVKIIVKALYYSVDAETIDDAMPLTGKMLANRYKRHII